MRRLCALTMFAALSLGGCASGKKPHWTAEAEQSHRWGYYSGFPETRWDSDGRTMTLLNELRYTDPQGTVWIAPEGSVVDGASIPKSLWSIMGGPFEGKYRNGSVLHDVSYEQHNRPWQECDRMFYNAMRCSGVSAVEAGTMYLRALQVWAPLEVHHQEGEAGQRIRACGQERTVSARRARQRERAECGARLDSKR